MGLLLRLLPSSGPPTSRVHPARLAHFGTLLTAESREDEQKSNVKSQKSK